MHRHEAVRRTGASLVAVMLATLLSGGCTGHRHPGTPTASPRSIPQPPLGRLSKLTRSRLAPDSRRVDLVMPSFSTPTRVTNPLFPVATLDAVIVGEVDGQPLKIETTRLPETRTENIPGVAFEQVTVERVGVTVTGPGGPSPGPWSAGSSTRTRRPWNPRRAPPATASGSRAAATTSRPTPWPSPPTRSRPPPRPS